MITDLDLIMEEVPAGGVNGDKTILIEGMIEILKDAMAKLSARDIARDESVGRAQQAMDHRFEEMRKEWLLALKESRSEMSARLDLFGGTLMEFQKNVSQFEKHLLGGQIEAAGTKAKVQLIWAIGTAVAASILANVKEIGGWFFKATVVK